MPSIMAGFTVVDFAADTMSEDRVCSSADTSGFPIYYPSRYPYYYPRHYPYGYSYSYPEPYTHTAPRCISSRSKPTTGTIVKTDRAITRTSLSCPGGWARVVPTPPPPGKDVAVR